MRRPWPNTTRNLEPGRPPEAVTHTRRPGPGPSPTGWTNRSRFFRSMVGVVRPLGTLKLATSLVTFAHYTSNRVSSRRRLAARIIYSDSGHHVIASMQRRAAEGRRQIAAARKRRQNKAIDSVDAKSMAKDVRPDDYLSVRRHWNSETGKSAAERLILPLGGICGGFGSGSTTLRYRCQVE
jgi:hypothetical protein